jgi:hypothetical protein
MEPYPRASLTVRLALRCHRAALAAGLYRAPPDARVCIMRCRTRLLQRTVWNGSLR